MSKAIEYDQLPKEVVKYIKELEARVNGEIQGSVVRLRDALKIQIDNIVKLLENSVVLDVSDADDKTLDRTLKLSTDSKKIVENLIYFNSLINPVDDSDKKAIEGSVESYVKQKRGGIK